MASASKTISLNVTANTQKYVAELRKLGTHTEKQIGAAARKASATFQRAELQNIKNAQKAARKIEQAHRKAAESWKAVGAAVVAALSVQTLRAVSATIDSIQGMRTGLIELNTTSGVATETLAGLAAAAARNGKEISDFDSVLKDLPKRILETSMGIGRAARGFDGLGVSVTSSTGELRNSDDVLKEVLSKLQSIEDPTRRAALAVQTLGGDGAKLMQVLGGTELETFIQYASDYGMDVGPAAIKSAEDWAAAQAELGVELNRIASQMVDAIDLTEKLRGFTTGLVAVYTLFTETIKDAAVELVTLSGNLAEFFTMGASDASAVRAMREMHFATGDAADRTVDLLFSRYQYIDAMQRTTDATTAATAATREDAAAMAKAASKAREYDEALKDLNFTLFGEARSDLADRFDKVEDAFVRRLDQIQSVTDAAEEAAATEEEVMRALDLQRELVHQAELRRERDLDKARREMRLKTESDVQNALSTTGQLAEQVAGLMKKGSKEAAIAAKAAAIVQAVASAYAAANSALAIPIVGPALAGVTLGIGLANVASIAATPIPAFATGGIVQQSAPRVAGNALDERLITARPGEEVVTPDENERRWQMTSQPATINLNINNRTTQRVISSAEKTTRAVSRAVGAPTIRQSRDRRAA